MTVRATCAVTALVGLAMLSANSQIKAQQKDVPPPGNEGASALVTATDITQSTAETLDKSQRILGDIDRLMSRKSVRLDLALSMAKAAFLLGRPSKAIAILEKVVQEQGSEKMPGVQFPVAVVGNLWIGTFARHAGNPTRGEAAYRDVLSVLKTHQDIKGPSVLAAICYLYLAEIETHFRARPEKAVVWLKELIALPQPKDRPGNAVFQVYLQWGKYCLASLIAKEGNGDEGPGPFTPPYGDPSFLVSLHCTLAGLDASLLQDLCGGKGAISFFRYSLERVGESTASPMDRTISYLVLGYDYRRNGNWTMARTCYGEVLRGESFFAPLGGIGLAESWLGDNKPEEAKKALQEVARRFPKYKGVVEQLLKRCESHSRKKAGGDS